MNGYNILNLSQKSITIPTHTNQFPAVEKMAPVVVVHIQWRCHLTDPEAIAQSLYDADLFARKVLCTEINAFHLSSAGRGAFFYFGWPKALDDNAWLATRGVLRLLQFANTHPDLELRAALHTGVLLSSIKNTIPDLLGDITEETGLLCQSAQDGQALISERCYQLVKHRIKAQKVIEHRRRIDGTLQTSYLLIGMQNWIREDHSTFYYSELLEFHEELSSIFNQTKEKQEVELVHIVSPAGTGKSTQVSSWFTSFFNKNQLNNIHPIKLNCYPDRQKYSLFPIISWIRQLCGGLPDYPANISDVVDFFNSITCNYFYDFSNLIDIITANTAPSSQKIEGLYNDLIYLFNYCKKDSLIIWIEDAHWIDEATHQFLELLTEKINEAALVIITARQIPFPSRPNKWQKVTIQKPSSTSATQLIRFFNLKNDNELTSDKIDEILELSNHNLFILEHICALENSIISLPLQHYFSFKIDQNGILIEQNLEKSHQPIDDKSEKEKSHNPLLIKTLESLTPPTHLTLLYRSFAIKLTKKHTNKEPDISTLAKIANYWLKSGEKIKSQQLYEKIANQTYANKEYKHSAKYFSILTNQSNSTTLQKNTNHTEHLIKLIHSRIEAYGPSDFKISKTIHELQTQKENNLDKHSFMILILKTFTNNTSNTQKAKNAIKLLTKSDCNIKKCITYCLISYAFLLNANNKKAILYSKKGLSILNKIENKELILFNRETIFCLFKILLGLSYLNNLQIDLARHCAEELLELNNQKNLQIQLTEYDKCRILFFSAFIMCHTNQKESLILSDLIHQCIDISSHIGQPLWTSAAKTLDYIRNNKFNSRNIEIQYHIDNIKVNFRELYPLLLSLKSKIDMKVNTS